MKTTARIIVQESFCDRCASNINRNLQALEGVDAVQLFPEATLVTFTFERLHVLSTALNLLTAMGYPEMGERTNNFKVKLAKCSCSQIDTQPLYLSA